MDRHTFFSLLFILSTLLGALHELSPAHQADDNCPICLVQSHSVADVVNPTVPLPPVVDREVSTGPAKEPTLPDAFRRFGSRDPPLLSV